MHDSCPRCHWMLVFLSVQYAFGHTNKINRHVAFPCCSVRIYTESMLSVQWFHLRSPFKVNTPNTRHEHTKTNLRRHIETSTKFFGQNILRTFFFLSDKLTLHECQQVLSLMPLLSHYMNSSSCFPVSQNVHVSL